MSIFLIYVIGLYITYGLLLGLAVFFRTAYVTLMDVWELHIKAEHTNNMPKLFLCDCATMQKKKRLFDTINSVHKSGNKWVMSNEKWLPFKWILAGLCLFWPIWICVAIVSLMWGMIGILFKKVVRSRITKL